MMKQSSVINQKLLNTMMSGFARRGDLKNTLCCFQEIAKWDGSPDIYSYNTLINACAKKHGTTQLNYNYLLYN